LYQFEASKKIIDRLIKESWLLEAGQEGEKTEKQYIQDVNEIIEGFINWERFDHKDAMSHFRNVKLLRTDIQQNNISDLRNERNHIIAKISERNLKNIRLDSIPTRSLIVDILQNENKVL
jgi:hypothetical protein